jgi:hypothetical protein
MKQFIKENKMKKQALAMHIVIYYDDCTYMVETTAIDKDSCPWTSIGPWGFRYIEEIKQHFVDMEKDIERTKENRLKMRTELHHESVLDDIEDFLKMFDK